MGYKWFRKPRFLLVYPLLIWFVFWARTTETGLRIGVILALLGETIRLWANGYVGHVKVNQTQKERGDAKIGQLITGGPYAYVRHPLYLGTFLIGAGFCVIVGNIWLAVVALIFFLLVYQWRMGKEEMVLLDEWDKVFERYRFSVPRWIPIGRRYDQPTGSWSWQGIQASKELKTLVWVIVLIVLMYFREEFIQKHELFLGSRWLIHVMLLVLMIGLIASDVSYELSKYLKRSRAKPNPLT